MFADGLLTGEQLSHALGEQKKRGLKLGRLLIELGYVPEDKLMRFIAQQLEIRFIDLRHFQPDHELVAQLPETYARRFRAIVLEEQSTHLLIGMADPQDVIACDELARILKRRVQPAIVRESDLLELIDRVYRRTEEISSLAEELHEELGGDAFDLRALQDSSTAEDTVVVRLLQTIFEDAVRANASDIHIEPDESGLRVRQRIDGVLYEHVMNELRIASALVLRLKLMASLDISEKRRPQDGRFNVKLGERSVDVRLSTMPVQYGESVVMRLLDQSASALSLDQLGLSAAMTERLRSLIHRPHGILLVTGPTGSGKTTTLYAALSELNVPEKKIITIEDPIEYRLARINQVQVNPKIDLTFASVLRATLRQDPDILMVGEMRDRETVKMALRAALTGHFVLSTLHTNDAVSSVGRLLEMGTPGYLIASGILAVVAQRLVRVVCEECVEPFTPSDRDRARLEALRPGAAESLKFQAGRGCARCNETGYRGRTGVYELLELNLAMMDALRADDNAAYTRAAREAEDYVPLVLSALDLAAEGRTTVEEVLRLDGEQDE